MKYYFELRKDKVTQDSLMPIRVLIKHERPSDHIAAKMANFFE